MEGVESSATTVVPAGAIILATRIVPGKTSINTVPLAINQDLKALLPKGGIHPPYLLYFLRSIERRFENMGVGSTVKGVTLETLGRIRVPVPAISEQRRIATILDNADTIRRKRHQSLRVLDELPRSSYVELVGPGNPQHKDWPAYPIAELAARHEGAIRTGPFGSALRHSEFSTQGEVAVLGIDNVVGNRFRWHEPRFITKARYEAAFRRYTVRPRDVLITIMGTTGRSAVTPGDLPLAISTKHLAAITPDSSHIIPEWLSYAIHSDPGVLGQIAAANRGAIMAGLNLGIIKQLKVRVPPLDLQKVFAHIVTTTHKLRDRLSRADAEDDHLQRSLEQMFFEPSQAG